MSIVKSVFKRAATSASLKVLFAATLFFLALASTATGRSFHGLYVFEPFFTRLDASLFVLASLAFLISAARQIFRRLSGERLFDYNGESAIPADSAVYVQKGYYLFPPREFFEPPAIYMPAFPAGPTFPPDIDSG